MERRLRVKFTKKHIIYLILVIGIAFFISAYKLPFYIYKPGGADALNPIVEVEDGYESEGDMHLVTVRGGQATPVQYLWAKSSRIRRSCHYMRFGRKVCQKTNIFMHSC